MWSKKALSYALMLAAVAALAHWYLNLYVANVGPIAGRELPLRQTSDADIQSYLDRSRLAQTSFGGKAFVSFADMGGSPERPRERYVWVLSQEYYLEGGLLAQGTGASVPVVLRLSEDGGAIDEMRVPGDGAAYSSDVERLFPRNIAADILKRPSEFEQRIEAMRAANERSARRYFFLPNRE